MAKPVPVWKKAFNWISTMMCCSMMMSREEKRPTTELTVNGTKAVALWDSGADCTVCSAEFFRSLKDKPVLMKYTSGLTTASGDPIKAKGLAKLRIRIGNYDVYHETVVLENLRTPFIIGVDLMEKHNYIIDIGNKKIKRTHKTMKDDEYGIYAPKNFHLEPLQIAMLEVRAPLNLNRKYKNEQYIVSGDWVPDGLCELDEYNRTKILVANKSTLPVQIYRGEMIGSFEEVTGPTRNLYEIQKGETRISNDDVCGNNVNNQVNKNNGEGKRIIPQEMIDKACENVPIQYRKQFGDLLQEFSDIFAIDSSEVGSCDVIKSRIDLKDPNAVVARPPYRIPHHLAAVVDVYVKRLLDQGVIEKSTSCWQSPLMLVKKGGNENKNKSVFESWRIVQDFRLLNRLTVPMRYPSHHLFDLLDRVSQGEYFSILDLASGFWNQSLEEDHRKYTAFSVPGLGMFQWTRTSQGLANSGPYFQKLLDYLTSGIKSVYVYTDDVIVSTKDLDSQIHTLRQVFERFRKFGMKCRVSKVKLCAKSVNYLGFELNGSAGIRPSELKTKAIREFPEPTNVTQIKSWLGLTSFYRRVIPYFSEIARPLTVLTRKDSGYSSGKLPKQASESFRILKEKLSSRPCVQPVRFDRDFIVTVDSSQSSTGVILSQISDAGVEHPCIFLSKTHSDQESRRSSIKLESEGIIWAMRALAPLVTGGHTVIRSDHKPLQNLDKQSTPILDRIHAELENFSYEIHYMKGKLIPADPLSRIPNHDSCKLCTKDQKQLNIISSVIPPKHEMLSCPGRQVFVLQTAPTPAAEPQAVEPPPLISGLTLKQIIDLQKGDYLCKAILCWLRFNALPNSFELRNMVLKYGMHARVEDGVVGIVQNNKFQILAPLSLRHTLMHLAHDHELSGHLGSAKTLGRLDSYFWPTKEEDVKMYISGCIKCNQNNPPSAYTRMPLRSLPETVRHGQRVHLDLIGPYPHSGEQNYRYALVMCDSFSSFLMIQPLKSKEAPEVAKAFLNSWITTLGLPEAVSVDQGSEYTARVFKELCKLLKIELKYVAVDHAQANGQIERQNRNILTYIRKYIEENNDQNWSEMLNHISFAMNSSIHADKHRSPFEMMTTRKPITVSNYFEKKYSEDDFEQLLNRHFRIVTQVKHDKKKAFETHKRAFDRRANAREYIPGDCIYISHRQKQGMHRKMQIIFDGPFIMTRNLSHDCIECEHMVTGKRMVVHKNRTKPATAPQQIWREAGKVDANLPQPITEKEPGASNENFSYPFEEPSGDSEAPAAKSYGYGLGPAQPQTGGVVHSGGVVRCQPDFKGQGRPGSAKESADNLEFNGRRHPPAQNSTHDVTASYYGPMTRARKREMLKSAPSAG